MFRKQRKVGGRGERGGREGGERQEGGERKAGEVGPKLILPLYNISDPGSLNL